jgi:Phospholipid methyltransferase
MALARQPRNLLRTKAVDRPGHKAWDLILFFILFGRITSGPYAYVRHPGYIFGIALTFGIALALGSLWTPLPAVSVPLCLRSVPFWRMQPYSTNCRVTASTPCIYATNGFPGIWQLALSLAYPSERAGFGVTVNDDCRAVMANKITESGSHGGEGHVRRETCGTRRRNEVVPACVRCERRATST